LFTIGLLKVARLPELIRNPLQSQEYVQVRYSQLSRLMRPHMTFIMVGFGLSIALFRYEMSKYLLYVKY
jgi:hypothetical protein